MDILTYLQVECLIESHWLGFGWEYIHSKKYWKNIIDENKYVRKCKNSNAVVLEIGNFLWNYSWSRNLFPWWILLSLINRQGALRPLNLQMENQTISDRSYTM